MSEQQYEYFTLKAKECRDWNLRHASPTPAHSISHRSTSKNTTPAKEQSAYFNLGFAGASASYSSEVDDVLEAIDALPGVDHIQVALDLALYFPVGPGALLGLAINGIGDRYEFPGGHLQINQYLYAASFRFYPGRLVGHGVFLRGDLGVAQMGIDATGIEDMTSDSGLGLVLGGGYSWQIADGTWLSLNADLTSKSIEDESIGGVTVGVALLF